MVERNSRVVDEEEEDALGRKCNVHTGVANWGQDSPVLPADTACEAVARRDTAVAAAPEMRVLAPLSSFSNNNHRKDEETLTSGRQML